MLQTQIKKPVTDSTGLEGKYAFVLTWTADAVAGGRGGPTLPAALRNQLGLDLRPSTRPVDMVVIDHIEKHLSKP